MGAAIIAALASILVAGITYASNKDLMEKQQDYNKDMLEQQNEYNTPSAQMERLKEAGVNPSTLAMNGGQSVMNQSASPLPFNPLPTDFSSIGNMMTSLSNSKLQFSQARTEDLLREERYNNLKLQNDQYVANIQKIGVDIKGVQIANEYAAALNEVSLMKSRSEIGLNFHQIAIAKKEIEKMKFQLEQVLPQEVKESVSRENLNLLEQEKVVAEIERIFYQNEQSEAETAESVARKDLLEAQTKTEQSTQDLLEQQTNLAETQNQYLDKQVQLFLDTYDQQVEQIATDLKISKKQAQWFIAQQLIGAATQLSFTAASGAFVGKSFKRPAKVGF